MALTEAYLLGAVEAWRRGPGVSVPGHARPHILWESSGGRVLREPLSYLAKGMAEGRQRSNLAGCVTQAALPARRDDYTCEQSVASQSRLGALNYIILLSGAPEATPEIQPRFCFSNSLPESSSTAFRRSATASPILPSFQ